MYGIDGRRDLTETTRDDLSGYVGARPVRVGNGAFDQRQNDVYGAALDSILLHTRRSQRLPRRLWPIVVAQAEGAMRVWREPDQGIWEARGDAAALRVVEAHVLGGDGPRGQAGRASAATTSSRPAGRGTAEEIKADILEHGVDARGVLRQHYATDALDASTLLAAIFGFLPGDDERLRASVLAIADELTEHGFVLRYKTGETDDGLSGKEGTFLICSFWLVSALAIIGELQRARDLMERLLREASPLGLYAEEFDADTSRHLGNFPQAFSHLALIEAAARIILAERMEEMTLMSDYDVIVIGSGAGGGTLVRRLASTGKRILLLERGDWLPREPANWDAHAVFVDNRYVSEDTWYDAKGKPFQPQVHYCVGGATKLYGAALYRLRAEDFGALEHYDGTSPAWPIGYDEMEPYYTLAEQLYQVHGARGEDPTEPPASAPYPFPAVSHEPRIQQLVRRPRRGRPPSVPRALRRHARRGEHAVRPLRALRHLRRLPLPRAREVRRRGAGRPPGARASERHAAHERRGACGWRRTRRGTAVTGVVVQRDGARETFAGDIVVVSCGAANSAKLLLASASDAHPGGLANGSDEVGRNYMFHNSQAVLALSKEPNPTVFQKTLGINDFYFGAPDFDFPLGNIQMVGKSVGADVPRREADPDEARPGAHARAGREPRGRLLALDGRPAAAGEPRDAAPGRERRARLQAHQRACRRSGSTTS